MNTETFVRAEKEAHRFLAACKRVRETSDEQRGHSTWPITGTKETGALRRASMDLTRALAALRKA